MIQTVADIMDGSLYLTSSDWHKATQTFEFRVFRPNALFSFNLWAP